jgi:polar amino acid transport system substrate-binding protein
MKTKKTLLIGAIGLASMLAPPALAQHAVTFTTEAYPALTYREPDGTYRGAGVEQVGGMMRNASIPFTMEIMPWARAIALAETQPMHCVFAAARTAEREPKFKWISPLNVDRNFLVRNAKSAVHAKTLEEAKRYTIGTHRADYTESLLRERGFPTIDLSADFEFTLNKLLEQRIDMMPMSESAFEEVRKDGKQIEKVVLFSEQQLGIACNKDMPDRMIEQMQEGLDILIRERRQDAILERYGIKPLRWWDR